ncbi:unnamed protein product, partial [Arabidopsis halleri]
DFSEKRTINLCHKLERRKNKTKKRIIFKVSYFK